MREKIAFLLAAVCLAGCASTTTPDEKFNKIDTNCDRCISWQEYKAYRPDADKDSFLRADQNRDERIDSSEWRLGGGYFF